LVRTGRADLPNESEQANQRPAFLGRPARSATDNVQMRSSRSFETASRTPFCRRPTTCRLRISPCGASVIGISRSRKKTYCVDWLAYDSEGLAELNKWRVWHLAVRRLPTPPGDPAAHAFGISPQVLFVDVDAVLQEIEAALARGDATEVLVVQKNYPAWEAEANAIRGWLALSSIDYLKKVQP